MSQIIAPRFIQVNSIMQLYQTIATSYKYGMTIQEIRLANLRQLVLEKGTATRIAELAVTAENHLNQVLRGATLPSGKKRGIGDELARKLETGCGKPVGWMDVDHSANNLPPQDAQFIDEIRQDVAQYEVPEHIKQAILTLITSSPKKQP